MFAPALVLGGCATSQTRPQRTQDDLLEQRSASDEQFTAAARTLLNRVIALTKAEFDRYGYNLADLGELMGANPASWSNEPPPL